MPPADLRTKPRSRPAADPVVVAYRFLAPAGQAEKFARAIAHEQTVEIPEDAVPARIRENVVGKIVSLRKESGAFVAEIAYSRSLCAGQLPQLLNLIYGNVSIQRGIRICGLRLPDSLLGNFPGPRFGIPGLRKLLGIYDRPLLATAVKPSGASLEHFARLTRGFALGGGDIVKDDQNLADASFAAFKERVSRCQEAVEQAGRRTGRLALYCPVVTARHEELEERLRLLVKLGVRGVLMCPALVGLDTARHMAGKYPLVFLAHPSLTGTFFQPGHGIEPGLLLGKLFRLIGADASIFPNYGGRFAFTRAECLALARELRRPWGGLAPAFPMPAGGMRFENLPAMSRDYGKDSVFLIGGALLSRPEGIEKAARAFLARIRESF